MSRPNLDPGALLATGTDLLQREALALDEKRWDDWLALYAKDCEFWMPAWTSDDRLGADPRAEVSYFYYDSRRGLEDRVARIRSGRSPASTPAPRTVHILNNIRLRAPAEGDALKLGAAWVCHVYFPRARDTQVFFGLVEHDLALRGDVWRITRKKIVLQNEYVPTMLDIYCV